MNLSAIVAVDKNWAIGYQNNLLVKLPEDHKMLSAKTKGQVIVMGRKTLESLPGGKPLKDRTNIILTRQKEYKVEGAIVCYGLEQMLELLKTYSKEVFVFGGEMVYKELLPYCTKAYITKINHEYEADAYFPNLDKDEEWYIDEKSDWQTSTKEIDFCFISYCRRYQG